MSIAIWVVTILVAGIFGFAGFTKMYTTKANLHDQGMEYVEDFSEETIKAIGVVEVIGVIGLIVPGVVGVATFLVPLAAIGLSVIMVGAIVVHYRRREMAELPMNALLLAGTIFVAAMRLGPYPL